MSVTQDTAQAIAWREFFDAAVKWQKITGHELTLFAIRNMHHSVLLGTANANAAKIADIAQESKSVKTIPEKLELIEVGDLGKRVDAYCKKHGVSRDFVINKSKLDTTKEWLHKLCKGRFKMIQVQRFRAIDKFLSEQAKSVKNGEV